MCGIVGIITKKNIEKFSGNEFFNMCRTQKHRGPDDEGAVALNLERQRIVEIEAGDCIQAKGLLGFERLSIQDLSYNGHQPMQNEDATISIVFNGEVYNFIELRKMLVQCGHKFIGNSDTEVILHMYMEYGIEKTVRELNGMFAFAIADMNLKKLFIVRDRFGIKPLYMTITEDAFLFASELKSFLTYKKFSARPNMKAVEEYILFQQLMKSTLLVGVEQILPGSLTILDLETNELKQDKYFDVENYQRNNSPVKYQTAKEKLWETLHNCVKRQVISDVKVGCQLSGGVDSSILTKIVADEHGLYDTVSCKTVGAEDFDGPYIDFVNQKLSARSHIKNVDDNVFIDNMVDVVWHFESVMSHTPSLGMLMLSRCAKENGITVLLSGEGSDELFGGYKYFTNLATAHDKMTESEIVDAIVFRDGRESTSFLRKIFSTIEPEEFYQARIEHLGHFSGSSFDRQVKYELTTQLRELLYRQDKMSMANSVENRVPYLDNEMLEAVWDVPEEYIMHSEAGEGKYILKDIASDLFGKDFAFRKKSGFFIPGNMFLSRDKKIVHRVLSAAKKRGIVCCDVLEEWADTKLHTIGGLNHFQSALFLKMFTLEIWCQLFIDGLGVEECKYLLK